jgi:hypothetical protein
MAENAALLAAATLVKTRSADLYALLQAKSKYSSATKQATVDANTAKIAPAETALHEAYAAYDALITGVAPPQGVTLADLQAGEQAIIDKLLAVKDQITALGVIAPVVTPPVVTPPAGGTTTDSTLPRFPDWGDIWGEWDMAWHSRGWNEGSFHAAPSVYPNVTRLPSGAVKLAMNSYGEAGLYSCSIPKSSSFAVEMDIEILKARSGVVIAPVWLWSNVPGGTEFDFEVAGLNGLQINVHNMVNGSSKTLSQAVIPKGWEGDCTGKRARLGFTYKGGQFCSFTIDGKEVYRSDATNVPGGVFPSDPLGVLCNVWGYPGGAGWVGPFTPFAAGEESAFLIHGLAYQVI